MIRPAGERCATGADRSPRTLSPPDRKRWFKVRFWPMTGKSTEQTLEACDPIIEKVIHSTNLDRVFFGDRGEARQHLRMIVIEHAEMFQGAPAPLRWVILYRRAL